MSEKKSLRYSNMVIGKIENTIYYYDIEHGRILESGKKHNVWGGIIGTLAGSLFGGGLLAVSDKIIIHSSALRLLLVLLSYLILRLFAQIIHKKKIRIPCGQILMKCNFLGKE